MDKCGGEGSLAQRATEEARHCGIEATTGEVGDECGGNRHQTPHYEGDVVCGALKFNVGGVATRPLPIGRPEADAIDELSSQHRPLVAEELPRG